MAKFSLVEVDLKALAPAAEKFIDAVQGWWRPSQIRREAEAEADALVIRTAAEIEQNDMMRRAAQRMAFQEGRRQQNIEGIVEAAFELLPEEVSDEATDPDWVASFFSACQDVSDQQLREVWAKILAREIADPGLCSRRTLSLLRDLGPEDAERFERLGRLVWTDDTGCFVPLRAPYGFPLGEQGITLDDCLELEAAGLIHSAHDLSIRFDHTGDISFHGLTHEWTSEEDQAEVFIIGLTSSGVELLPVSGATFNEECYMATLQVLIREHRLPLSRSPPSRR